MIILNLIAIAVIVVYVIDLAGFVEYLKMKLWKWLKNKPYEDYRLKPFDCSLCMSHHMMLLYLICTGNFSLGMWGVVCLISYLSIHIKGLLEILSELITKAENKLNDIL